MVSSCKETRSLCWAPHRGSVCIPFDNVFIFLDEATFKESYTVILILPQERLCELLREKLVHFAKEIFKGLEIISMAQDYFC